MSPPKPSHMPDWYGMMPQKKQKVETDADLNEVEGLIANSMAMLSMEDREQAMEDVHGIRSKATAHGEPTQNDRVTASTVLSVQSTLSESPTMKTNVETATHLKEMEALLQRSQNNTYLLALRQNKEYVTNTHFRLSFLNSLFDPSPQEAVEKILRFLELKLELFGKETLSRDLTLADLGESGQRCLRSGLYQYLGRDSAGRRE